MRLPFHPLVYIFSTLSSNTRDSSHLIGARKASCSGCHTGRTLSCVYILAVSQVERRRNSLVLWRGSDEYDRFAEVLGATLPRITDGSIESSAMATSEGVTEYLELTETAEELEKGERTPVKRSIPQNKAVIKEVMAGLMKMSSFVGRGDGKENPSDYIADVEMAAQLLDATVGQNSNGADASKIPLFRQNLDKDCYGPPALYTFPPLRTFPTSTYFMLLNPLPYVPVLYTYCCSPRLILIT